MIETHRYILHIAENLLYKLLMSDRISFAVKPFTITVFVYPHLAVFGQTLKVVMELSKISMFTIDLYIMRCS